MAVPTPPAMVQAFALTGLAGIEFSPETSLVSLLGEAATRGEVRDGDVLVVTSKVISKMEGRVMHAPRDDVIAAETVALVAQRGPTQIVRNSLGLVMAAAGVDASNVATGSVVALPVDPDASARALRAGLAHRQVNVAIVITDTSGRAWRHGQTDLAIGTAGIVPLQALAGEQDAFGNALAVTAPAVADEIAGVADLVKGKLSGCPVAVVRGLAGWVLPVGDDGPGARSLNRSEGEDMFALGAREAVKAAVELRAASAFGPPVGSAELIDVLAALPASTRLLSESEVRVEATTEVLPLALVLAHAHGWHAAQNPTAAFSDGSVVLHPRLRSAP